MRFRGIAVLSGVLFCSLSSAACTSALVPSGASKNNNVMLWKHRDTSHSDNFIDTVRCVDEAFDYVALFNAGDSLKREAWAGVNRSGFAIINTVAGNLPANAPGCIDREGIVMTAALRKCVTIDDFAGLLDTLSVPRGVRTNFGVADKSGAVAYFETSDTGYVRYSLPAGSDSVLIRTNFSFSSHDVGGYGHERYETARRMLLPMAKCGLIGAELFTEVLSRDYIRHTDMRNMSEYAVKSIADRNYIPRPTSSASVVIELTREGPVMWCVLGYPPASYMIPATVDDVPAGLRRDEVTGRSPVCDEANARKRRILTKGKISLPAVRRMAAELRARSFANYDRFRKKVGVR